MVQMFMRDLKKVSALERFCYKEFLRNSSGTKFFVRLREVSALEDVRLREVPLYVLLNTMRILAYMLKIMKRRLVLF